LERHGKAGAIVVADAVWIGHVSGDPHASGRNQKLTNPGGNDMRIKCLLIILCGIGFALVSPPASAQKVTTGGLSGTIVSANVHLTQKGYAATMLTTPSAGSHFILTYFCAVDTASLIGRTFGRIARTPGSFTTQDPCRTFTPGIALPAGEELICTNQGNTANDCTISGVVSKQ